MKKIALLALYFMLVAAMPVLAFTGFSPFPGSSGATVIDDTKGNGDTDFAWSANKIFDQLALKQAADADLTTYAGITPSADIQTFLGYANFAAIKAGLSIDDLVTLSGVADGSVNLGTFTGSTIADSVTIKAALQALETSVETKVTTETDPVAGAITGIVKADGAGNLSAAVSGTDYSPPITSIQFGLAPSYVVVGTVTAIGAADTQFDITNPSGTTIRYTWDTTGTDPGITAAAFPVGTKVYINAQNFNAANNSTGEADGTFSVTGSGTNYIEITNAAGVVESNKTIGTGSMGPSVAQPATINSLFTRTDSMVWDASAFTVDGTQCTTPASAAVNSGPILYTTTCADNDAGIIYGSAVMPDSWDAGTVTLEVSAWDETADPAGTMAFDASAMCRRASDTLNNTFGDAVALDMSFADAGTAQYDVVQTTSGAITPNGTCAAGALLIWKLKVDATATDATAANIRVHQVKMEFGRNARSD